MSKSPTMDGSPTMGEGPAMEGTDAAKLIQLYAKNSIDREIVQIGPLYLCSCHGLTPIEIINIILT